MAFISTTRPSDASGEVLEMYERQQAHWGYIPDYAKVFSHRPEALARWGRLLAELRRPVSDYRFELVTTAAALELRRLLPLTIRVTGLRWPVRCRRTAVLSHTRWESNLFR